MRQFADRLELSHAKSWFQTHENAAHQTFFRSGTREAVAIRLTGGATDCGATHCDSTHCDSTHLTSGAARHRFDFIRRGDQSPLSTFGLRPPWTSLRARRSKSTNEKHPLHRDGGTRSQPARDSPRRLEATRSIGSTRPALHCGATSESAALNRATDGLVTPN